MQRLPSLTALRAFECTARHKSFTKAADELCVTAPSLSHHVKALEHELGCELFKRKHRSIELTDEGERLFAAAKRAFGSLAKTWHDLKGTPRAFKMSCGIHFMANWLAPRSAKLQFALNDFEIDLISTFELLNFELGEVDLAIRNGNQEIKGLHSETIYKEWWTPMVSPDVARTLKTPSDLLNFPLIESRRPREPEGHPSIADWLIAAGVNERHPNTKLIRNTETAMQMAAEGVCVKLTASILAGDLHRQGKLVAPFDLAIRREDIRFYMVCRECEQSQTPVTNVRNFFKREFLAMDKAMSFQNMTLFTLPAGGDEKL